MLIIPRILILLCLAVSFSLHAGDWRSPLTVEGTTHITTEQAKEYFDKGTAFIDVRNLRYFTKRHIPGAYHLDLKKDFSEANLENIIAKDEPAVIYCNGAHCPLSYRAATKAVAWGFTRILYYRDGFRSWRLAGYPYEKPAN